MKLKEQQIFSSNIVSDVHPSIRLSKREEKKRKKKKLRCGLITQKWMSFAVRSIMWIYKIVFFLL